MKDFPALPMLYFEMRKATQPTDIADPIKKFIFKNYQEPGSSYSNEIAEFEQIRNEAVGVYNHNHDVNGCSRLKKYYSQLFNLNNKAKILNTSINATFTWVDNYNGQPITGGIRHELNSILYNIGALHSELGATDSRTTEHSIKAACAHFQCAAWTYTQLAEVCKEEFSHTDFDLRIISSMHDIMLGQAQECIVEKSILDDVRDVIIAKVAAQVVDYYQDALVNMFYNAAPSAQKASSSSNIAKATKYRRTLLEYKIDYFKAVSFLFMGNHCAKGRFDLGSSIAWYKAAEDILQKLEKTVKASNLVPGTAGIGGRSTDLSGPITAVQRLLSSKRSSAQWDNDHIYHEKVPAISDLTAVEAISLVKDIGFSVTDSIISGPDIFQRLVPIEAHQAASIYSDSKDRLLRDMKAKIEEKNEELATFMSSIDLDKDKLRPPAGKIPDKLIEVCASLSVNPMIVKQTEASLECLEQMSSSLDESIKEAYKLIADEEDRENKSKELYGTRSPNSLLNEYKATLNKLRPKHEQALLSNANLRSAMQKYGVEVKRIAKFSAEDLERILDPLRKITVDEELQKEMERLFDKVEEMKSQRVTLFEKLRESVNKDDILKDVLATAGEDEGLFERELKKFDGTKNLLEQNLAAQENILLAITRANAKFATVRIQYDEVLRQISEHVESLIETYKAFMQLRENILKGEAVYKTFEEAIETLITKINNVIDVQKEHRKSLEKSAQPAHPDLHTDAAPNSANNLTDPGIATNADLIRLKMEELRLQNLQTISGSHLLVNNLQPNTQPSIPVANPNHSGTAQFAAQPGNIPMPQQQLQPQVPQVPCAQNQVYPGMFQPSLAYSVAQQPGYAPNVSNISSITHHVYQPIPAPSQQMLTPQLAQNLAPTQPTQPQSSLNYVQQPQQPTLPLYYQPYNTPLNRQQYESANAINSCYQAGQPAPPIVQQNNQSNQNL